VRFHDRGLEELSLFQYLRPVFLKNKKRIEAVMFLYFVSLMIVSLIEIPCSAYKNLLDGRWLFENHASFLNTP